MNGFSKGSAVSLQLFLEESGVHTGMQYTTKCSCSSLSRTFNNHMADGIFFLLCHCFLKIHSLLQRMSSDKTFQTKGKCVSLGDLDQMAEEEYFLECAGELEEDNDFSRKGLCSTMWPWEYLGRSN